MNRVRIFVLLVVGGLCLASCSKEAVSNGYQDNQTYTSSLEKKYASEGGFAVTHESHDAAEPRVGQHQVWYPSEVATSEHRWPVVVLANGTGVNASRYEVIFRHMASWGFVVVGNEDASSWDGLSTIISLKHLLDLDKDPTSPLYGKVDTTAIGQAGHSQGGVAVFNAATMYDLSPKFKAICSQSCTSLELAEALKWPYHPSLVNAPTLIMAGTGAADSATTHVTSTTTILVSTSTTENDYAMYGDNSSNERFDLTAAFGLEFQYSQFRLFGGYRIGLTDLNTGDNVKTTSSGLFVGFGYNL